MAIPFNLPSDEDTEENYRRLDQLLQDLYFVLRQILLRPRTMPVPSTRVPDSGFTHMSEQNFEPPSGPGNQDLMEQRLMALPDLVRSVMSPLNNFDRLQDSEHECHCDETSPATPISLPRHHQTPDVVDGPARFPQPARRKLFERSPSLKRHPSKIGPSPSKSLRPQKKWVHVGEELRSIAEDFRSTFKKSASPKSGPSQRPCTPELKASSLFSLLVPSPLGKSVWTTIIFIVGWRIITRLQ